jgi:MATE family multidrug resistance protein
MLSHLSCLNTLCAQAYGAKNFKLVGIWFQVSIVLFTLMALILAAIWSLTTEYILRLFNFGDDITRLGTEVRQADATSLLQDWRQIYASVGNVLEG